MDDEARNRLRGIGGSVWTPEDAGGFSVFVSHADVEKSRKRTQREKYVISFFMLATFCIGLMAGWFIATHGVGR